MLAYAANAPRFGERRRSPKALGLIVAAHAVALAALMTAKMDVKGISIDPSLIKPDEREILEDLVVTALGDARRKAEVAMQEKMQALTGGLGLPPGLGFS